MINDDRVETYDVEPYGIDFWSCCSWSLTYISNLQQARQDGHLLELLRWMIFSTNKFYGGLHRYGLWIPADVGKILVQHAYAMTATETI